MIWKSRPPGQRPVAPEPTVIGWAVWVAGVAGLFALLFAVLQALASA